VASAAGDQRVGFVDAEEAFRADSSSGVPGRELFHEHVHMTFRGDYLLARSVYEEVTRIARIAAEQSLLDEAGAAQCVGYNAWAHYNTLFKVLNYYIRKSPFTGQLYHEEQVQRLEGDLKQAEAALTAGVRKQIAAQYRALIQQSPSDLWLRLRFAEFASVFLKDEQTAVEQCRRVQELVPHSYKPHVALALSLGGLQRFDEAIEHLNRAVRIKPTCAKGYHLLGLAYQTQGRVDEAMRCFARAVRLSPDDAEACKRMADILLSQGKVREARAMQRKAELAASADAGSR
jgi:tetratricopeptide (TPR) repeat protein